jgi:hypothetical protein
LPIDFQRRHFGRAASHGEEPQANFPEQQTNEYQPADPPLFSATDTAVRTGENELSKSSVAKGKANVNSGGLLALRSLGDLGRIEAIMKEERVAANKEHLTMEGNDGDLLKQARQAMKSREDNENNDESRISRSGDTSA